MKLTMKINNIVPLKNLAVLAAAFCTATFAFNHNASAMPRVLPPSISLTFGGANDLGFVGSGIPSGDADRKNYVNHLIAMTPGTQGNALSQHFERSLKNPGPGFPNYPTAVFPNGFAKNGGPKDPVDLGNGTLYSYLFAKYDGKNAGSEVWYVGGISGIITIPAEGIPGHGHQYGLSGWSLFGPGATPPSVPDGGATVMLLGAALGALGAVRRFFKS
jgi:protein with PEP-CTERM/exosortase system signal